MTRLDDEFHRYICNEKIFSLPELLPLRCKIFQIQPVSPVRTSLALNDILRCQVPSVSAAWQKRAKNIEICQKSDWISNLALILSSSSGRSSSNAGELVPILYRDQSERELTHGAEVNFCVKNFSTQFCGLC